MHRNMVISLRKWLWISWNFEQFHIAWTKSFFMVYSRLFLTGLEILFVTMRCCCFCSALNRPLSCFVKNFDHFSRFKDECTSNRFDGGDAREIVLTEQKQIGENNFLALVYFSDPEIYFTKFW